ncbi:urease accessory protein UreD [Streptomyces sp. TP-A0874]|uniref:urease accessory protein UreD n=1 Tax=Streptomyces sp. TP-A0874 TaxID=549819 RepID=UPI00085398A6|nr:urease accessory protein UreD [Streptomyces sp. TP-A0874]
MATEETRPTVVEVHRGEGGAHIATTLRPGTFLTPRPLHAGPHGPRIALVGSRAGLLSGDDLRLRVRAGAHARLELLEPAGLVAYDHRGGRSSAWRARVDLGDGALLVWPGRPFVAAAGAATRRCMDVRLGRGARMLWRETLVLGRSGERGGGLRSLARVRSGGTALLVEDLDLSDPEERELPGIIGSGRVMSSVAAFGWTPDDLSHPYTTPLAQRGAVIRLVSDQAHTVEEELDAVWQSWLQDLRGAS